MKIKITDIENLATAILHRMPFTAALPTAAAGSHRWILSTGFSLSIYDFFLPPDIKGLNARRYLSLVVSTQWLHIVSTLLNATLINFSKMLCHKVINNVNVTTLSRWFCKLVPRVEPSQEMLRKYSGNKCVCISINLTTAIWKIKEVHNYE